MIHICTVHWQDDRWVDVQLEYLDRHLKQPFRIYGWLNDLPVDHSQKFFYSTTEPVPQHAIKLNILADVVRFAAESPKDTTIPSRKSREPVPAPYGLRKSVRRTGCYRSCDRCPT